MRITMERSELRKLLIWLIIVLGGLHLYYSGQGKWLIAKAGSCHKHVFKYNYTFLQMVTTADNHQMHRSYGNSNSLLDPEEYIAFQDVMEYHEVEYEDLADALRDKRIPISIMESYIALHGTKDKDSMERFEYSRWLEYGKRAEQKIPREGNQEQ